MATERRVGTRRGVEAEGRGWALAAAAAAVDAERRGRDPARHRVTIAAFFPQTIRSRPLPRVFVDRMGLFLWAPAFLSFSPLLLFFLFSCTLRFCEFPFFFSFFDNRFCEVGTDLI